MQSRRSASEQSVWASSSAASGSISPKSTTSGFSGAMQAGHSGASEASPEQLDHPLERLLAAALEAHAPLDRPVHLDQAPSARRAVEAVDVLGDHPAHVAEALELGHRRVGRVRRLSTSDAKRWP